MQDFWAIALGKTSCRYIELLVLLEALVGKKRKMVAVPWGERKSSAPIR